MRCVHSCIVSSTYSHTAPMLIHTVIFSNRPPTTYLLQYPPPPPCPPPSLPHPPYPPPAPNQSGSPIESDAAHRDDAVGPYHHTTQLGTQLTQTTQTTHSFPYLPHWPPHLQPHTFPATTPSPGTRRHSHTISRSTILPTFSIPQSTWRVGSQSLI